MPHYKFRNVNDAFQGLVSGIHNGTIPTEVGPSRIGEVAYIPEPVTITYTHPREKVLFNRARDCNPFFHLYESLWMLAGRNDIAPLAYYSSNYAKQVQDGTSPYANGAYGYRWRHRCTAEEPGNRGDPDFEVDQLTALIYHLKRNPWSRRAVLQMWTVEEDLMEVETSKDVCCNVCAFFSIEAGKCPTCNGTGFHRYYPDLGGEPNFSGSAACLACKGKPHEQPATLNMTVCNRSNDLIWGTLGANAVHFAFLQEYLAAHLGLEVGVYNQFSNNQHVYTERFEAEKWLAEDKEEHYPAWEPFPFICDPKQFDRELPEFVERHKRDTVAGHYSEPFLAKVAQPLCVAFHYYKRGQLEEALGVLSNVEAEDWRIAAKGWIQRRIERRRSKTSGAISTSAD